MNKSRYLYTLQRNIVLKRTMLSFVLVLLVGVSLFAQPMPELQPDRSETHSTNFGVKAGFNSTMFLVSEFKINDVTIDRTQNNYKIGYFAAFFMRVNGNRHFVQPEVSFNISKCEISFDKLGSQHPDIEPEYAAIISTIRSVDVPLLYGYHLVKKGPYGMSLFIGPKLRYIWPKQNAISFDDFDQKGIREQLYPFTVNAVVGLSVNISRIFFDFRYEQGLQNISKSVKYDSINPDGTSGESNITFKRRDNVLSFSLGVIF